jgi:hypothetical protein
VDNSIVEDYVSKLKDKSQKMAKLLENELFVELIIDDYIKGGILSNTLDQSLDNMATVDELKARQNLHKHIFSVIIVSE